MTRIRKEMMSIISSQTPYLVNLNFSEIGLGFLKQSTVILIQIDEE